MKKRITFELEENDILYKLLLEYSKNNFMTLTGVIKLALQRLFNGKD